jgi:outer membrane protein assembly factor BamB
LSNFRQFFTVFLIFCCLLMQAGCAGLDVVSDAVSGISEMFSDEETADPPAKLAEDFQGELQVDLLWKESVGEGADEKYLKLMPLVNEGRIYVADHKGLLQSRSVADGDLIWEKQSEYLYSAGPSFGNHYLILGTSHGEVLAYDIANGDLKWSVTVPSEVLATPVITSGKIIIRTTDGKVLALRESDGGVLWATEHNVPALSIRGEAAPLVVEDKVLAGTSSGKLLALQLADGKVLWEVTIAIPAGRSEVERLVDLDADPVAARGSIFLASYQGGASAVSAIDGDILWRNDNISAYTGISNDYRYLYLGDIHSEVWQLDQRNGASLWKQKDLHNRQLSPVSVYGNFLVVGDFEGYVHWLSITDGRLLGRIKICKAAIESKPIIVNDVVYVYAKDGTLAALRAK